jgi:hypothetical protein
VCSWTLLRAVGPLCASSGLPARRCSLLHTLGVPCAPLEPHARCWSPCAPLELSARRWDLLRIKTGSGGSKRVLRSQNRQRRIENGGGGSKLAVEGQNGRSAVQRSGRELKRVLGSRNEWWECTNGGGGSKWTLGGTNGSQAVGTSAKQLKQVVGSSKRRWGFEMGTGQSNRRRRVETSDGGSKQAEVGRCMVIDACALHGGVIKA